MRIQHNIMAMNAYRNYNNNTSALSSNLEKLSSGYKINRAGDDAAGLAISEKMRAQITGLEAAQKNVKDGISLVKTAEGAMQEIQDMLNRMDYLATQSANGTYDNEVDRANLQKEVDALKDEINRIADSANFNGIKLLDGSLDSDADLSVSADFTVGNDLPTVGQTLGVNTVLHNEKNSASGTEFDVDLHNFSWDVSTTGNSMTMKVGDTTFELTATSASANALSGSDLASAILGGTTGVDVKITQADGTITNITGGTAITGMQINGQDFAVEVGSRNSSNALHFTQIKAPTSKDTEVNGAMNVTLSGVNAAATAVYKFDLSGLGTGTITAGTKLSIAGTDYAVTADVSGATALATALSGQDFGNYTATASGSELILTAKTAGAVSAAPAVSISKVEASTAAATEKVEGADAVTATYTAAFLGDGTAITTGFAPSAGGSDITTGVALDDNWTATYTDSGDAAVSGTITISAAASGATTAPLPTVAGATFTVATTGADAVTAVYEYDVSDWDGVSTITIGGATATAGELTGAGKTMGDYTATLSADKKTLILTANDAGTVSAAGAGPNAAPGSASFNKLSDAESVTVTETVKGASAGDLDGITEGANGDWNVATTNIQNVTSDGIDRLASTYFTLTEDMAAEGSKIKVGDVEYTFTADKKNLANTAGNFVDISSGDINQIAKNLTYAASGNTLYTVGNDGNRMTFTETDDHYASYTNADGSPADGWDLRTAEGIEKSLGFTAGASSIKSGKALTLQIGDTSDSFNQMKVSVGDMHTKAMGSEDGKSIADIDISTQDGAAEAVNVIKDAINYVSSVRGDLGAIQNRLEHTQNNLSVMAENIQDAESTIRDTDVAEEMMSYVKNNILVQSAQAMLAQANQVPQGVLQLLG